MSKASDCETLYDGSKQNRSVGLTKIVNHSDGACVIKVLSRLQMDYTDGYGAELVIKERMETTSYALQCCVNVITVA
eukprot:scaffold81924_cov54-Attheya_sp.AAC.2